MSEKENDQAHHEMQLAMTRAEAAGRTTENSAKFAALVAQYGGAKNIPENVLAEHIGPMKEVAQMMRLTSTMMDLSTYFDLDFLHTNTAPVFSAFINARLSMLDLYETIDKLFKGPDEDVRPGVLRLMIRLEDITEDAIAAKNDSLEAMERWNKWMNGPIFGGDKLND